MKGIVIAPEKSAMGLAAFPDEEKARFDMIYKILQTESITFYPIDGHIMYFSSKLVDDIPFGKRYWGFTVDGGQNVLGRAVILGLGERGEDTECILDRKALAKRLEMNIFYHMTSEEYLDFSGGDDDI